MERTVSPGSIKLESPSVRAGRLILSIRNRARSSLLSIASISVGLQRVPSANSTENSLRSPITWKLVAMIPSDLTIKPVPTPHGLPLCLYLKWLQPMV